MQWLCDGALLRQCGCSYCKLAYTSLETTKYCQQRCQQLVNIAAGICSHCSQSAWLRYMTPIVKAVDELTRYIYGVYDQFQNIAYNDSIL